MFQSSSKPASTRRARSLRRRMTDSEARLWAALRPLDANFRRQAPIGPFFADFATHSRKIVIEVDGGVHQRLDHVALRDGERQLWLQSRGYSVLRFTDAEVDKDVAACIDRVKDILAARGWKAPDEAESELCAPPSRWSPTP